MTVSEAIDLVRDLPPASELVGHLAFEAEAQLASIARIVIVP